LIWSSIAYLQDLVIGLDMHTLTSMNLFSMTTGVAIFLF